MNIAYILRGLPGSGKSTVARNLVLGGGIAHSTDDFCYVDGVYVFDPMQLTANHDRNFAAFCDSLAAGVPVVVCDNTNVLRKHFGRYVSAAKKAGYLVAIVTLPHPTAETAAKRNTHSVSLATIQRMIDMWEE